MLVCSTQGHARSRHWQRRAQSIQESIRQARELCFALLEKTKKQIRVFQVASLFEMSKWMGRDVISGFMRCTVCNGVCVLTGSFFSFIYLIGYDLDSLVHSLVHRNDWQTVGILTQFQEWSSWLLPAFLFYVVSKNVCFHLLHSPSHWHAPQSITNSGFFSCLISSQSAFVQTFLMLNTWINFILHCVNHKAVHTWMYTTSQGLSIFFLFHKKPQKANYI